MTAAFRYGRSGGSMRSREGPDESYDEPDDRKDHSLPYNHLKDVARAGIRPSPVSWKLAD
jgi:hypothetical protein